EDQEGDHKISDPGGHVACSPVLEWSLATRRALAGRSVSGSLHDAKQLVDRRLALDHLAKAVFLQVDHPVLPHLGLDRSDRQALADHMAHRLGDDQKLEDPGTAEIAGTAALGTTLLRLGWLAEEHVDLVSGQVGLLEELGLRLVRLL